MPSRNRDGVMDAQPAKTTKKDRLMRKWLYLKHKIYMALLGAFWRPLYKLKVARFYSAMKCKFNFYAKLPDGRCMWCGEKHFGGSDD